MGIHILAGALKAALIELACPHCGEKQLRARAEVGRRYRCKHCQRLFSRADGEQALAKRKR
jgi:transposase-like protein